MSLKKVCQRIQIILSPKKDKDKSRLSFLNKPEEKPGLYFIYYRTAVIYVGISLNIKRVINAFKTVSKNRKNKKSQLTFISLHEKICDILNADKNNPVYLFCFYLDEEIDKQELNQIRDFFLSMQKKGNEELVKKILISVKEKFKILAIDCPYDKIYKTPKDVEIFHYSYSQSFYGFQEKINKISPHLILTTKPKEHLLNHFEFMLTPRVVWLKRTDNFLDKYGYHFNGIISPNAVDYDIDYLDVDPELPHILVENPLPTSENFIPKVNPTVLLMKKNKETAEYLLAHEIFALSLDDFKTKVFFKKKIKSLDDKKKDEIVFFQYNWSQYYFIDWVLIDHPTPLQFSLDLKEILAKDVKYSYKPVYFSCCIQKPFITYLDPASKYKDIIKKTRMGYYYNNLADLIIKLRKDDLRFNGQNNATKHTLELTFNHRYVEFWDFLKNISRKHMK